MEQIIFMICSFFDIIREKDKEENNILAYSKSMFAYGLFGFCNEWYLRDMPESPENISAFFSPFIKRLF